MRLHRPILAGIALSAVLPVTAASAAAGVTPAGSALSSATLVSVSVGELLDVVDETSLSIGTLSATAENVTDAAPAVTFVPITLNGVKTGEVTVTPANSPQTVGGVATGSLAGLLSATSPGATLTATDGAKPTSALTASLGEASILGLPITLDGGVEAGSTADSAQAMAAKGVTLSDVSLPNIADLLAALGIDLAKLPVGTLNALIEDLRLAISEATQTALDAANAAYDTAAQNLADASGDVTQATSDLNDATASLEAALSGADLGAVVLPGGVTAPLSAAEWDMLDGATQDAIEALPANAALAGVAAAYETAKTALTAAEAAVAPLQAAVDAALAALAGVVEGVLGGVPLVEVGAADIGTKALVGKTKEAAVTGFVSGVKVLGTDILADVTGDSEVDAAALVGDLADEVNAALNTATTALSNALSSVTGATGLVVPAPVVEVMKKTTTTGTDGVYGTAMATLTALSISLGSVTVPDAFALAGAGDLPGLGAITGGFKTAPLAIEVGAVVESARFRSGTTTPGNTGSLPTTGGPTGLAIVAVIGTALAVGVRRLRSTTA